jgi:hypothetical protein
VGETNGSVHTEPGASEIFSHQDRTRFSGGSNEPRERERESEIFGVPGYAPIGMTEQMDGKGRMETPRVKN